MGQILYLSHNQLTLDVYDVGNLLNFQVSFKLYWGNILQKYKRSHAVSVIKKKQGRNIPIISKKIRYTTVNSHINSSEPNSFSTTNSDNVTGNSNLPRINVQTKSSFNTRITLKKLIQSQLLVSMIK